MSLGLTLTQADVFTTTTGFCESRVSPDSIYGLLHRECFWLFGDDMFADLFADSGRNCVPPMIVAVVMVLQRFEGCSDRDAVDRFAFDARWKYAAGGLSFGYPSFVHTVLVDMRARLRVSERPDRIFEAVLGTAKQAGLVGRRRVLDSTSLYDAVATMDTVTLIRSAIRGLLVASDRVLEQELRGLFWRDDDYASAGKSVCDYEDRQAREELIDALAKDARALLGALDGRQLGPELEQAAGLLAAVVGQDLDEGEDGVFRIARRVAKDRSISTVDPHARHGHETSARGLDGYKGHVAVDPDSELITATTVTAGNVGDGQAVDALLADELANADDPSAEDESLAGSERSPVTPAESLWVYGDSAYGAGSVLDTLEQADAEIMCKVQPPVAPAGRYAKDAFEINLEAGTVTCPAGQTALLGDQGRAHRPLRPSVPGMPARRAVHHLARRALDPRRRLRATAHPRPRAADRPGVEGRLHRDPPKGGAQDQPSDATPARRPSRSSPRAHQSRCRLLAVGCRGEPRQARDARCHPPHRRLGSEHRVTPEGAGHTAPQRPARPDTARHSRPPSPKRSASHQRPPRRAVHRAPHGAPHPRRTPIYTSLEGVRLTV